MPTGTEQIETTIADEDRLSAVVVRLRKNIIDAHKFRPTDPAILPDFERYLDDMLQTLVDTTTAAAVDKAKIIVTKDLSLQRQQFQIEAQRIRSDADLESRKLGAEITSAMLAKIASRT